MRKVKFEAVLDGIARFMDKEIYSGMNDWQEIIARLAVGQIFNSREAIKAAIVNNGFIRTFGIIDENGDIDIERLATDLKAEMQRKKEVKIPVKWFGEFKFLPSDVDTLYEMITGKKLTTETMEVPGNETD
ncbi:MAG: hypothetical protein K2K34_01635 [Oscillospiraceae bacterium]|nr:hypothetical protein [Oscillospiraceae bacterium]